MSDMRLNHGYSEVSAMPAQASHRPHPSGVRSAAAAGRAGKQVYPASPRGAPHWLAWPCAQAGRLQQLGRHCTTHQSGTVRVCCRSSEAACTVRYKRKHAGPQQRLRALLWQGHSAVESAMAARQTTLPLIPEAVGCRKLRAGARPPPLRLVVVERL